MGLRLSHWDLFNNHRGLIRLDLPSVNRNAPVSNFAKMTCAIRRMTALETLHLLDAFDSPPSPVSERVYLPRLSSLILSSSFSGVEALSRSIIYPTSTLVLIEVSPIDESNEDIPLFFAAVAGSRSRSATVPYRTQE